ncbi:hypothetical protein IFM89_028182 [Coptis chinensis]|uniref:Protein kinase domain-containing protein n=1 Tax=Coptis chinensis TaxID=261450 RepID=A0A835M119_9MAGN|nr:hypothetical protein IFM89_028182 [Coptis chinensis]
MEDFVNEVATIGKTNHVNVVTSLAFVLRKLSELLCNEVHAEWIPRAVYLQRQRNQVSPLLGWEKLYQITLGIARGLEYLHRGFVTLSILHFDIKPHNILLDEDFCKKFLILGWLNYVQPEISIILSWVGARGTPRYIAPSLV